MILERETITSDQNQAVQPHPGTSNGYIYLPQYGPIPRTQASCLSLGHCYLGQRTVVLTVRDVMTVDTVKIYLMFSTRPYPIGLLPGAVVAFQYLQHHVSKQGKYNKCFQTSTKSSYSLLKQYKTDFTLEPFNFNLDLIFLGKIYLSFEACSSVEIESLPRRMQSNGTKCEENPHIPMRQIIEYMNFQISGVHSWTLSYILCHIVAVQRLTLWWTCSLCRRSSHACSCCARQDKESLLFNAKAQ